MAWNLLRALLGGRHADQWSYTAAADEIQTGIVREGLMLKAAAQAEGDAARTKALYLKFLAEQIAEETARTALKSQSEQVVDQAKTLAVNVLDEGKRVAIPAANAGLKYVVAFIPNFCFGVCIALTSGWIVAYLKQVDAPSGLLKFVGANLFSGGAWISVLGVAVLQIVFCVLPILAFLMLFDFMRRNRGLVWLILLIPVGGITIALWKGNQLRATHQASTSPTWSQDSAYERALRSYEQEIPAINSASPEFDAALANRVAAQVEAFRRSGSSPEEALERAIRQTFPRRMGSSSISAQSEYSAYENLLRDYEQQIPQINPNSPHFDQALTDHVAALIQKNLRAGNTAERSLQLAVLSVFAPPPSPATSSLPERASDPQASARPSDECWSIYWSTVNAASRDMPTAEYVALEKRAKEALSKCR